MSKGRRLFELRSIPRLAHAIVTEHAFSAGAITRCRTRCWGSGRLKFGLVDFNWTAEQKRGNEQLIKQLSHSCRAPLDADTRSRQSRHRSAQSRRGNSIKIDQSTRSPRTAWRKTNNVDSVLYQRILATLSVRIESSEESSIVNNREELKVSKLETDETGVDVFLRLITFAWRHANAVTSVTRRDDESGLICWTRFREGILVEGQQLPTASSMGRWSRELKCKNKLASVWSRLRSVRAAYERESTERSAGRDEGQQTPMGNAAGCAPLPSPRCDACTGGPELRRASRDAVTREKVVTHAAKQQRHVRTCVRAVLPTRWRISWRSSAAAAAATAAARSCFAQEEKRARLGFSRKLARERERERERERKDGDLWSRGGPQAGLAIFENKSPSGFDATHPPLVRLERRNEVLGSSSFFLFFSLFLFFILLFIRTFCRGSYDFTEDYRRSARLRQPRERALPSRLSLTDFWPQGGLSSLNEAGR